MSKTKPNLEELTERKSKMFQATVYSNQYIGPLFSLYKHWHEEIELIYIVKGRLVLNVNGQSYVGQEGECFIINAREIHNIVPYEPNEESSHHAVVWNLDVLKSFSFDACQYKYIEPIQDGKLAFPTVIEVNTVVADKIKENILSMVEATTNKRNGWELVIKVALYQILMTLIVEDKMLTIKEHHSRVHHYKYEIIKKAVDYIHQNFSQKISVHELAQLNNLNRDYFIRLFKESIGQTPIEYINAYRIEHAARLLLEGSQSVLEISLECGFENNSYFIKKFKEKKGITPKQFQKRIADLNQVPQ